MRKSVIVSALALAIVGLSATAATAKPLKGSLSGTATVHFVDPSQATLLPLCAFPTPCALGNGTGTGHLSGLGKGKVTATSRVASHFTNDPNRGDFNLVGTSQLHTKRGTLFWRLSGHGSVTSSGDFVVGSTTAATITADIVAGTGRFDGATGKVTVRQSGTLVDIFLGDACLGALNDPCLQFQSADHSTWKGRLHVPD